MLFNLESDKIRYKTHKITSQKLFMKETDMMEDVIMVLNNIGVDVVYVFDALYTQPFNSDIVRSTMNKIANKYHIKTKV
jgi:hypothetical protein